MIAHRINSLKKLMEAVAEHKDELTCEEYEELKAGMEKKLSEFEEEKKAIDDIIEASKQ